MTRGHAIRKIVLEKKQTGSNVWSLLFCYCGLEPDKQNSRASSYQFATAIYGNGFHV